MTTPHDKALEAATKAWMDDRGIDSDISRWRDSIDIAISAYLSYIGGIVCTREPSAWSHQLNMELGQFATEFTREPEHPFGEPGEDYSPEYTVTSSPLHAPIEAGNGEADAIHSGGMRRHADTIEAKLVSLSKENEQLRMKLTPANSGSGTVHHIDRLADAIHLLDEASGFAAVSPAGRDNIEQVSDMLPEIVEQAYRVGFVDGEKHATECYGFELQPARLQNEWLKDKLADILLPPNSQKNNEEFLIELGMPIAGEHR